MMQISQFTSATDDNQTNKNSISVEISSVVNRVLTNEGLLFMILEGCDDETRASFIRLSKRHAEILTTEAAFQWRTNRLHVEYGVYCHPLLPSVLSSDQAWGLDSRLDYWKDLFLINWRQKNLWSTFQSTEKKDGDFHVHVTARFKPRTPETVGSKFSSSKKSFVLPLHQRLALIRMNQNLSSNQEALKVLSKQGAWFNGGAASNEATDETMPGHTLSGGIKYMNDSRVVLVDPLKGLREFVFDRVLDDETPQEACYEQCARSLVSDLINGYNGTCFGYGQTGSGKTFTMFGLNGSVDGDETFQNFKNEKVLIDLQEHLPASWGIIPRAFQEIFRAKKARSSEGSINTPIDMAVSVSYVEIFGDSVTDLLDNGKPCGNNTASAQRYVLESDEIEQPVDSLEDALKLLAIGESQKRKAATAMNAKSSRAHSIVIIKLHQQMEDAKNDILARTSRLFFADLGGSEKLKKSQAKRSINSVTDEVELSNDRDRAQEAININLGLLALKQCVEALRRKKKYVPFSDSKLTMILKEGLKSGSNCKTSVIVCGAQEEQHGPETISTMKFGQACRGIVNNRSVTNTVNMLQNLLTSIDAEISSCEEKIQQCERWELVPIEEFDNQGQLIGTRQTTRIVGAERYRGMLEVLLRRKSELIGEDLKELAVNVAPKDCLINQ